VLVIKMRTVSFVDCFELEFEGSVFSKAMIAADVDNDNVSITVSLCVVPRHTCTLHAGHVAVNFLLFFSCHKIAVRCRNKSLL